MSTQIHSISKPVPHLHIRSAHAEAMVCLQGAQIMHFQPEGERPLLWAADRAHWVAGKNLRGGVPVCWPWFGAHRTDKNLPAHGWVRQRTWELQESADLADGATRLRFAIRPEQELAGWPATLELALEITIGRALGLRLVTRNAGALPVRLEDALHTYFAVSDVRAVRIHGVGGHAYLDQFDGMRRKQEPAGAVAVTAPTCRTYLGASPRVEIEDPAWNRRIVITHGGAGNSVLWSPGAAIAATMGDLGGRWPEMVCLEAANCGESALELAPGAAHATEAAYAVEPM